MATSSTEGTARCGLKSACIQRSSFGPGMQKAAHSAVRSSLWRPEPPAARRVAQNRFACRRRSMRRGRMYPVPSQPLRSAVVRRPNLCGYCRSGRCPNDVTKLPLPEQALQTSKISVEHRCPATDEGSRSRMHHRKDRCAPSRRALSRQPDRG